MGGERGRGGRRPWFPCCENIEWFQMCTFYNRRCRSENSEALHYLKLWYSFYIRVEYKRLHENNLAQRAQLMCPGRHWIGGGRGGKGGAMRAYQKWSCTTPYFLVIAEDQEG